VHVSTENAARARGLTAQNHMMQHAQTRVAMTDQHALIETKRNDEPGIARVRVMCRSALPVGVSQ